MGSRTPEYHVHNERFVLKKLNSLLHCTLSRYVIYMVKYSSRDLRCFCVLSFSSGFSESVPRRFPDVTRTRRIRRINKWLLLPRVCMRTPVFNGSGKVGGWKCPGDSAKGKQRKARPLMLKKSAILAGSPERVREGLSNCPLQTFKSLFTLRIFSSSLCLIFSH